MDKYHVVQLVKDWYRTRKDDTRDFFLLKNNTIISNDRFINLYKQDPSVNQQVIGYVYVDSTRYLSTFEFPMLVHDYNFPLLYLNKIGYVEQPYIIVTDQWFNMTVISNLKYFIVTYQFQYRLVIELVDLDVAANNLNLPKIVSLVLGPKLLRKNEMISNESSQIENQMLSQKLFGGHTWDDAKRIVYEYFDENKLELSKEVFKISMAYERVFRPYRVVYNTKTWEPVVF